MLNVVLGVRAADIVRVVDIVFVVSCGLVGDGGRGVDK